MKNKSAVAALALLALFIFSVQLSCLGQGTAFTYQGRLNDSGGPASGNYDLQFTIYDTLTGFHTIAGPITNSAVNVGNGVFTVTLDFGANAFTGEARWLDIAVQTNGAGAFTTLSPRQKVTPTPYAMTAGGLASVVEFNSFNASLFATVSGGEFNSAGGFGATVSGGIANSGAGFYTAIGGGTANTNNGFGAAIAGGAGNSGGGDFASIGGGQNNTIQTSSANSTITGGFQNAIQSNTFGSTISGGSLNLIQDNSCSSVIAGGTNNIIQTASTNSVIGGGTQNVLAGSDSTIGGGRLNITTRDFATIAGGELNTAGSLATVGGGDENLCSGILATISGGQFNISTNYWSTVAGGRDNVAGGNSSAVGGGMANVNLAYYSTIGGGDRNFIGAAADDSFIGGGQYNQIVGSDLLAVFDTIDGGTGNVIQTNAVESTIGGGGSNTIQSLVFGGTLSGGFENLIQSNASSSTVGGGTNNTIFGGAIGATIGGGISNNAESFGDTISGGQGNLASASYATVGGGYQNKAVNIYSTVPGGANNVAGGFYSFAAGRQAKATHQGAFVWADSQGADFSSTTNDQFNIRAQNGVRINDDTSLFFGAGAGRQMLNLWGTQYGIGIQSYTLYFRTDIAAPGGGFAWYQGGTNNPAKTNSGGGITLMTLDNSGLRVNGTFVSSSDRNVKAGFEPVDASVVLDRVARLPISHWHYTNDVATTHLGPMAQDFYAAFGIGPDDKHISMVDADGVALAAIQGLNEKVEGGRKKEEGRMQKLEAENAQLQEKNNSLEKRLAALEEIIRNQKSN